MIWKLVFQFLAAGIGTAAFAGLFHAPFSIYNRCFVIGGTGWILYYVLAEVFSVEVFLSTIAAAVFITFFARVSAVVRLMPVTAFLVPAVFPLIPGIKLYYTIFSLIEGEERAAAGYFRNAVAILIAIVFGILVAFEIPNKVFLAIGGKIHTLRRFRNKINFKK